ncbi:MAG: zinc ribbon domain-containing protein [Alphaproteobacteria bacterium]|nr:GTP-binding protein [Rhodocyclaceae bacterium]MCA3055200.1 GTP-binding protein [Rhodocyclaceae bacterium]
MSSETKLPYACSKCGHGEYEAGEIRASGGGWSAIFDFETERLSYVACTNCQHTEFYRTRVGNLSRVVDFLMT